MDFDLTAGVILQATVTATPISPIPSPTPTFIDGIIRGDSWGGIATIISLLIALIGLGITIYNLRKGRNRKLLGYEIRSDSPLLNFSEISELKGRLSITLDDQAVEKLDINSVELKIKNAGDVPLKVDEYDNKPIQINFGEKAQVLTASVTKTEPPELRSGLIEKGQVKIHPAKQQVLIDPVLLNKGWSITIRTLVTQKQSISVFAEIAGVEKIQDFTNRDADTRIMREFSTTLSSAGLTIVALSVVASTALGLPVSVFFIIIMGSLLIWSLLIKFFRQEVTDTTQ